MKNLIKKTNIYNMILFFIFVSTVIIIPLKQLCDPDMFWHIQTGEYIIKNLTVPHSDVFSYYGIENNLYWTAHEWLSDVIFYFMYSLGGYKLLRLFPTFILGIISLIIFMNTKDTKKDNIFTYISYFVVLFTLAIFSEVRPHMFSFLLFTIEIIILNNFKKTDKVKPLYFIPLLGILWSNLHGGSSALILVVIFFYILFSIINIKINKVETEFLSKTKIKHLIIVLLLTMIGLCINPYGYKMLLYPITNMLDTTMLSSIVEWQSPNFHTPEGIVIYCIIMYITCILILHPKKISLLEITFYGAFIYLSLKSIRQISYCVIALLPIILYRPLDFIKINKDDTKNVMNFIVVALTSIFIIFFSTVQLNKSDLDLQLYPSDMAMSKIEELKPNRMLNDYDWGGYFIKEFSDTDIKPFIDGRADIYSKVTMNDYSKLYYLIPGWEDIIQKYDFDTIIMKPDSVLTNELLKTSNWELYFEDETTKIIKRRSFQ